MTQTEEKNIKNEKKNSKKSLPSFDLTAASGGGTAEVRVSRVKGIEEYSTECILLKMQKGAVRVKGLSLELTVFEDKNVLVKGRVLCIEFVESTVRGEKRAD